jgi:hypothetical protein
VVFGARLSFPSPSTANKKAAALRHAVSVLPQEQRRCCRPVIGPFAADKSGGVAALPYKWRAKLFWHEKDKLIQNLTEDA